MYRPAQRRGWPTYINVGLADMVRTKMNVAEAGEAIARAVKPVINGASTAAEKVDYLKTNSSRFGSPV